MKRILAITAALTVATGSTALAASNKIDTTGIKVKGSSVTFPDVKASEKGFLVIHKMRNGKPVEPGSVGHTAIKKGDNSYVTVKTDTPLLDGQRYMAVLNKDSNHNGKFDFGKGSTNVDKPIMKQNGQPAEKSFVVPPS